jgi:hypothetical protein
MSYSFIIYLGITVYLVMAYFIFTEWLFFLLTDKEMNPEQRFWSRIILVMATIAWPIIVPFAYLELLRFHRKYKKDIDLLISQTDKQI